MSLKRGRHSWVWKVGSSWPPLRGVFVFFSCSRLCSCGRRCWVLGALVVDIVGAVGVVVIMGIVVGVVVVVVVVGVVVVVVVGVGVGRRVTVVVVVVVVVVVEAMVMVVTCHVSTTNIAYTNK